MKIFKLRAVITIVLATVLGAQASFASSNASAEFNAASEVQAALRENGIEAENVTILSAQPISAVSASGCEAAYLEKFAQYDKHATRRQIVYYSALTFGAVALTGAYIGAVIVSAGLEAAVIGFVSGSPVLTGYAGYGAALGIFDLFDKEDGYREAFDVITIAKTSEEDLKKASYEERVTNEVARLNDLRKESGAPAVNEQEIQKVRDTTPFGERYETYIDYLLRKIAKDGNPSYEKVRLAILELNRENAFCPKNSNGKVKLSSYRAIKRQLKKTFNP